MIMKLSMAITNFTWPAGPSRIAADLGRLVRQADDGGIHTVWVADHLVQAEPGTELTDPMLEAYTTLGYLAGITSRVRLGTAVSAVTFREPAMLIKAVTTLDVLSGGRAWLGIGAGYLQDEADMMGLPLPPTAERFERLEEALRLAVQMWSGDDSAFEGKHTRLSRPINSPGSLSRPHPPIMIGGTGEKKTLRLVARYAQACNLFDIPDGGKTIKRKLDVLARHCAAVGRPYEDIDKTVSTRLEPGESPDDFVRRLATLADLGIEHAVVITNGPWTDEALARLAAAAQAAAQL
jgi:F420-dependent oxidoreductase-like protein